MIEMLIEARRRDLGGFEVGRVLPFAQHRTVGRSGIQFEMEPRLEPKQLSLLRVAIFLLRNSHW